MQPHNGHAANSARLLALVDEVYGHRVPVHVILRPGTAVRAIHPRLMGAAIGYRSSSMAKIADHLPLDALAQVVIAMQHVGLAQRSRRYFRLGYRLGPNAC